MDRLRWLLLRGTSSLKHRVTRRLTPAGQLLLCGLVASAVWGMDTTQSMAYQLFTFLLALLLVSALSARFSSGRFSLRRRLPRFATAGRPLAYEAAVENLGARAEAGLTLFEETPDPRPTLAEYSAERRPEDARLIWPDRLLGFTRWRRCVERNRPGQAEPAAVPDLPPYGAGTAQAGLRPTRRGRLTLSRAVLAKPDPLGLVYSFFPQPLAASIAVLPKRYPAPRLALPGARRYQRGGVALSSCVGSSHEFMSLRDYRPGDPLRRIHWRSWPKLGRPVVREFEDEYFVRHALVLDTFAKPGQDELFEEAVSVAASFACSVLTQESLLDLLFVGTESYCFTAGRGLGGIDRMLEVLAGAQACRDKHFSQLAAAVLGRHQAFSGVLCVLLAWDEDRRAFIARLRGLGLPVLAAVVCEPGAALEPGVFRLEAGRIAEGLARLCP